MGGQEQNVPYAVTMDSPALEGIFNAVPKNSIQTGRVSSLALEPYQDLTL